MHTMLRITPKLLFYPLILIMVFGCSEPTQPRSHEDIIRADFTEILALENTECGEVMSYKQDGRLNYRIECENGDIYRIHVSEEGHVKLSIQDN